MLMKVLSQGCPEEELHPAINQEQRLGMMGLRDHWILGDLLLGSSFLKGQSVFEGVPNGTSYISMLLTGAVALGPFCLEFRPELHSDSNFVPCFSQQT